MHGGGLVTHMHDIEAGIERRVEDRHHVIARKGEQLARTGRGEGLHE